MAGLHGVRGRHVAGQRIGDPPTVVLDPAQEPSVIRPSPQRHGPSAVPKRVREDLVGRHGHVHRAFGGQARPHGLFPQEPTGRGKVRGVVEGGGPYRRRWRLRVPRAEQLGGFPEVRASRFPPIGDNRMRARGWFSPDRARYPLTRWRNPKKRPVWSLEPQGRQAGNEGSEGSMRWEDWDRAGTPVPGPAPDPDPAPVPDPLPPSPPGPPPPNPPAPAPGPPAPPTPNPPPERPPDEPPIPRAGDIVAVVHIVRIRDDEAAAASERRLRFVSAEEAQVALVGALAAGLWADAQAVHTRPLRHEVAAVAG